MNTFCIDIGGTFVKTGYVDENNTIFNQSTFPTEAHLGGKHLMETIVSKISQSKEPFSAIGVSTAGQIDAENGVVTYATDNLPNWTGMNIKEILENEFKTKVAVENDVYAAALGELYYGNGIGFDDFLCLTYGTGIGGAIIQNRKLYKGSKNAAGNFGHLVTHPNGEMCTCGNRGCYEVYASSSSLLKLVNIDEVLFNNCKDIFNFLDQNTIKLQVDKWIDEVIYGLISLNYIFNPKCIILGGGIMYQDYIINSITKKLPLLVMDNFKSVNIKKAKLANNAGIMGVHYLAKQI